MVAPLLPRRASSVAALGLALVAGTAAAQTPVPPAPSTPPAETSPPAPTVPPEGGPPPQGYPQQPPPQGYPQQPPPQGYPPGFDPNNPQTYPPGFDPNNPQTYPPGYAPYPYPYPYPPQGYGYPPGYQPAPPPPPPVPKSSCCRFSIRFDPFDLLFRRLTFEGEVKVFGPFSVGIEPSWIWGSSTPGLDEKGFSILGNITWTFYGKALRGFWLRAVGGGEVFDATLTHPELPNVTATKNIGTGIFGLMVGSSNVFGQDGGFAISGGIGIGVATSDPVSVTAESTNPNIPSVRIQYFNDASRIRLLGSLGLGVTF